jgi:hypothetical protein
MVATVAAIAILLIEFWLFVIRRPFGNSPQPSTQKEFRVAAPKSLTPKPEKVLRQWTISATGAVESSKTKTD